MALRTFDKCPFCGSEPSNYVKAVRGMSHDVIKVKVYCCNCNIEMDECIQSGSPYYRVEEAKNKLIYRWNSRKRGDENASQN